eukprot:TRINITY_DN7363_c0_g1_i1.p1 TRINITY_DN7363_c0_g1~~TRINITY_DN7363_c0_g1_i1.p1  ORF type:complete len:826 (-),score=170.60 TRINITY_DN7363_c0_g1_i1:39-2516(-)
MFIFFVVDTSASMNQKTALGLTLLDLAKVVIEHFTKVRGRDVNMRNDRYFLVTFEDGPAGVKVGWKNAYSNFLQEVKNLSAKDLTNLGPTLKRTFDLASQFRLQSGIDNYGQGRNPWYMEPTMVILITDGGSITTLTQVIDHLTLPLNPTPGSELTMEPFRWDQRLFSIVLKIPGVTTTSVPSNINATPPEPLISTMCEVTGGRCTVVNSMKQLVSATESLVQKMNPGVVVSFEPLTGILGVPQMGNLHPHLSQMLNLNASLHKMLIVRTTRENPTGFWPIPESFFPDVTLTQLPARTAHPVIRYTPNDSEPLILDNFPFDKYEIEPNPLTQYLLTYKQNVCWYTYISNSGQTPGPGEPFGYLKASSGGAVVNLFVFPYNFPRLFPLLEDLARNHAMNPTAKWRIEFEQYLNTLPSYYITPMKNALKRYGVTNNLIPDQFEGSLPPVVSSYIKKLRAQKVETDKISQTKDTISMPGSSSSSQSRNTTQSKPQKNFHQLLNKSGEIPTTNASSSESTSFFGTAFLDKESEVDSVNISEIESTQFSSSLNPFDFSKENILDKLDKMRQNVLKETSAIHIDESRFMLPVGQMGNYQEFLMKQNQLREVDEEIKNRPLFGNPFRIQSSRAATEEDDETTGEAAATKGVKRRRSLSPRPNSPQRRLSQPNAQSPQPSQKQGVDTNLVRPNSPLPTPPNTNVNAPLLSQPIPTPTKPHIPTKRPSLGSSTAPPPNLNINTQQQTPSVNIPSSSGLSLLNERDTNTEIKNFIMREMKKATKNYDPIFRKLKEVKGGADVKKTLLQDVIAEAQKFKKAQLIALLKEHLDAIED